MRLQVNVRAGYSLNKKSEDQEPELLLPAGLKTEDRHPQLNEEDEDELLYPIGINPK